jgi:hypothetical protein
MLRRVVSSLPPEYRREPLPMYAHEMPRQRRREVIVLIVILAVAVTVGGLFLWNHFRVADVTAKVVSCSANSAPLAYPNGNTVVSFNLVAGVEFRNHTGETHTVTLENSGGGVLTQSDAGSDATITLQAHETRTVSYYLPGAFNTDCSSYIGNPVVDSKAAMSNTP